MKILWTIPCVVLGTFIACNGANAEIYQDGTYPETGYQGYQDTAYQSQPSYSAGNPYVLDPPAYERQENIALQQKEAELFQKEKYLMESQQALYEREKKLACREAAFINRSKALDYKEQSIAQGRSYAPFMAAAPRGPMPMPAPAPVPAPVPAPMPAYTYASTYYSTQYAQPQPVAPQPVYPEAFVAEQNVTYGAVSQPATYDVQDVGFIIMQHPIQRDLIRCPVTDDVCLQSYERLGYVRSNNLSGFTSQDEQLATEKKPANTAGQWRENNSIPRW